MIIWRKRAFRSYSPKLVCEFVMDFHLLSDLKRLLFFGGTYVYSPPLLGMLSFLGNSYFQKASETSPWKSTSYPKKFLLKEETEDNQRLKACFSFGFYHYHIAKLMHFSAFWFSFSIFCTKKKCTLNLGLFEYNLIVCTFPGNT